MPGLPLLTWAVASVPIAGVARRGGWFKHAQPRFSATCGLGVEEVPYVLLRGGDPAAHAHPPRCTAARRLFGSSWGKAGPRTAGAAAVRRRARTRHGHGRARPRQPAGLERAPLREGSGGGLGGGARPKQTLSLKRIA